MSALAYGSPIWVTYMGTHDPHLMQRTVPTYVRTNERFQDQGENRRVSYAADPVDKSMVPIAEALADLDVTTPRPLAAVLNWMPRWKIPGWMRRAIGERDGWNCWICGQHGDVLDHLEPRSSFLPRHIVMADDSSNLRIACQRCNSKKTNKVYPYTPALTVIQHCGDDQFGDEWPDCERVPAWCAMCSSVQAVPESWIWEWAS